MTSAFVQLVSSDWHNLTSFWWASSCQNTQPGINRFLIGPHCPSLTRSLLFHVCLVSIMFLQWLHHNNWSFPQKFEEAFHHFQYVPYTTCTRAAYLKAAHGEEDFTINAQGGLSAKGLDQRNERSISVVDWYAAATAAKGHIREHFGETKAMALAAHHKIVMDLGCSHSWEIAMDYNISQCELVTLCPTHDLSTLATAHVADQVTSHQIAKPKSLPLEERLLPLPCHQKSGNTLLAPNRKHFCFNWSWNSNCHFRYSCVGFHGCSLCGESSHGAHAWPSNCGHSPQPWPCWVNSFVNMA